MQGIGGNFENQSAFRRQVGLPAVQAAALSRDELALALAYELEPFSNIPAAEAVVEWRDEPPDANGVKRFDVAIVRKTAHGQAPAKTSAFSRLNLLVAAVSAVAALLVAADCVSILVRRARVGAALAVQEPLDARLRSLEERASRLSAEAAQIAAARERRAAAQGRAAFMRSALPSAMDAIASVCGGRVVVRSFSSDAPWSISLCGVAASAENAADVMSRLGAALAEKGWTLDPGRIETSRNGATAEFSCKIVLRDSGEVK